MRTTSLPPAALVAALAGTALGQSTDPFPAQFQLSCLLPANGGDGSDGFVINGIDPGDRSGFSVSSAGDVNGDGFKDLIIGAPYAAPNGQTGAGETYVVFGGPTVGAGGAIELSSLDGSNGFVLNGDDRYLHAGREFGDRSGHSVSSAGDVNGDGIEDLIIGARWADGNGVTAAGESYVVFGSATVGAGGVIELPALNGVDGFRLNGIGFQEESGRSVSGAGDVNGDGFDDVFVGAPYADLPFYSNPGRTYVVFGGANVGAGGVIDAAALDGTIGFMLHGIDFHDLSGRVACVGDINADGTDDVAIGAPLADTNGLTNNGASYIVFGGLSVGAAGVVELSSLNGENGFVLNGINERDATGFISSAGDINDDGINDLIIGGTDVDPNGKENAGASYVVFGAPGLGAGGAIELSSLNGANGFVINGIDADDRSGAVSSLGDINGDGIDDLIIGASRGDPNGIQNAGESYVVFGGANIGAGGVLELSSLNGLNGFVLNGIEAENFGARVSAAGDVNADGIIDLIIGASWADPNAKDAAGQSYVIFGRNVLAPACHGDADGSGAIDFGDITAILGAWLNVNCAVGNGPGDADGSGAVDFGDITSVLANWSTVCP